MGLHDPFNDLTNEHPRPGHWGNFFLVFAARVETPLNTFARFLASRLYLVFGHLGLIVCKLLAHILSPFVTQRGVLFSWLRYLPPNVQY